MSRRTRLAVAALALLAVLVACLLLVFASVACPTDTPEQPCPGAVSNRVLVIGFAALAVGLLVVPFALISEFVIRAPDPVPRRLGPRHPRGLLAGGAVAVLGGLRLGGALSVPVTIFLLLLAAAIEWLAIRRFDSGRERRHLRRPANRRRPAGRAVRPGARRGRWRTSSSTGSRRGAAGRRSWIWAAAPGRLLRSFAAGKGRRIVGVDGSAALLRRAEARVAAEPLLAAARDQGRLHLVEGDVRRLDQLPLRSRLGPAGANLVVAAGVLPHLDGPEDAMRMLCGVVPLLAEHGRLILDDLGPALLPERDLPLSVDWRRTMDGQEVVRRSQLMRPGGARRAARGLLDDRRRRTTRWYDSAVSG